MPSHSHKKLNRILGLATATIALAFLLAVTMSVKQPISSEQQQFQALILRNRQTGQQGMIPWKTLDESRVEFGYTVPQKTNVIFHMPTNFVKISRQTLFGHSGETARYWGYCFPTDDSRSNGVSQLPGKFFVSEKEQAIVQEELRQAARNRVMRQGSLREADLNLHTSTIGRVQNQKDVFYPGESCYIMSDTPLPIGLDTDGDTANNRVEKTYKTDPLVRDTDGDGVIDGLEIFGLKTQPLIRDTDGDGLIDGMEDKNRNGRIEEGETSPLNKDSDGDGLCDGFCRDSSNKITFEDKNVNGIVDEGETDPLKEDTDGDGVLDEQEFFLCQLQGGIDCDNL